MSRPTVVFADEPTGNLDSKTGGNILELLHESVESYGQTMVMVTHEARAAATADRGPVPRRRPDRQGSRRGQRGGDPRHHPQRRPYVIRVALRGLSGRKFRAALTAFAIVLGVAMVSGTFVLTDTIDKAFDTIFVESYANTDAVIRGKAPDISFEGDTAETPGVRATLLERVRSLDGVEAAAGSVIDDSATKILKPRRQGDQHPRRALVRIRHRPVGGGVQPDQARRRNLGVQPDRGRDRRWDRGRAGLCRRGHRSHRHAEAGSSVPRHRHCPVRSVSSLGTVTFAVFTIPAAQELLEREGQFDAISVAAKQGVSPEQLVADIRPILPAAAEVQTGVEQAEEDSAEISEFTSFIRYFLLAFGGVALFVGAFVIFNTMSITVAQRLASSPRCARSGHRARRSGVPSCSRRS